jgi:hypothetical protein
MDDSELIEYRLKHIMPVKITGHSLSRKDIFPEEHLLYSAIIHFQLIFGALRSAILQRGIEKGNQVFRRHCLLTRNPKKKIRAIKPKPQNCIRNALPHCAIIQLPMMPPSADARDIRATFMMFM